MKVLLLLAIFVATTNASSAGLFFRVRDEWEKFANRSGGISDTARGELNKLAEIPAGMMKKFSGEWEKFKNSHQKIYSIDEELKRMKLFVEDLINVVKHNALFERGQATFQLATNNFTDWTKDEFEKLTKGVLIPKSISDMFRKSPPVPKAPVNDNLPASVDWREKGAVTPVKNQGRCGSCYAFSAIAALESQLFMKSGKLVTLSEQNIVDCSPKDRGCTGGFMDFSYNYIKDNRGVDTDESYPYKGKEDRCSYKPESSGTSLTSIVTIPAGDEQALKEALATKGPIAVTIDASSYAFKLYRSGVFYDPFCSTWKLNHGVLLVGYGTDEMYGDYWLVKNSWGEGWGDKGYIKMARNGRNHCGIAQMARYPLV